jgi:uncharacterized protein (TIGR02646 family)
MIAVVKPAAPAVLLTRGIPARGDLCAAYERSPEEYASGAKTFAFDDSIYAADEVKRALRAAQHDKCAFCESRFTHTGYGDIEHFRPKAGYKQRETDTLRRPGYFWLAYEWGNLFHSCQLCNQRFKRNLFPLKDGRSRARPQRRDVSKEAPLLIDPSTQDPGRYIGFREEYVFAVGGCPEGKATIEVLGLNREELVEVRRDRLASLKQLLWLRDLLQQTIATASTPEVVRKLREVETMLRGREAESGEYAAMTRAYVAAW